MKHVKLALEFPWHYWTNPGFHHFWISPKQDAGLFLSLETLSLVRTSYKSISPLPPTTLKAEQKNTH